MKRVRGSEQEKERNARESKLVTDIAKQKNKKECNNISNKKKHEPNKQITITIWRTLSAASNHEKFLSFTCSDPQTVLRAAASQTARPKCRVKSKWNFTILIRFDRMNWQYWLRPFKVVFALWAVKLISKLNLENHVKRKLWNTWGKSDVIWARISL